MSTSPHYSSYASTEKFADDYHYSQVVRIGNVVRTSGQGGWDEHGVVTADLEKQVETSFENVLHALKAADARLTFDHVYAIRSYHVDVDASFGLMTTTFKRIFPSHKPIWTCVQVAKLGIEGMCVEIEAEAVLPELQK